MGTMQILLAAGPGSGPERPWTATTVESSGTGSERRFPAARLPAFVRAVLEHTEEPDRIRWIWADTEQTYPALLEAGIELARSWDLLLCQRILRGCASAADGSVHYQPVLDLQPTPAEPAGRLPSPRTHPDQVSLFEDLAESPEPGPEAPSGSTVPFPEELVEEFFAQQQAVRSSPRHQALMLLLSGESQGALVAEEMHHHGLPWNRQVHEDLLAEQLGPRPVEGQRPEKMDRLAARIAGDLGTDRLNPDSPQDLLRAMHAAGMSVKSTRKWELMDWVEHGGTQRQARAELVAPILEYKQLYRLWTANGWHWLDEWVEHGRFHPRYVVGGVVTGRWAAHGGGAMQIPKIVRDAVRADPGQVLTVADASQVEPRILAAMSQDRALAVAGQGKDLYLGIAEIGQRTGSPLKDRSAAKIALLGAMYGATTGDAGALMPHFRKLFPQAIEFTERAAQVGERGGQVRTWLGRTSPLPEEQWFQAVRDVGTAAGEARSRGLSRSQGRFTRNFVVQGTAAEWALCWMGETRRRLRAQGLSTHMVFFVHDEIVLHGPEGEAAAVQGIVAEAASAAGRLLFGQAPVEFPLTVAQVQSYAEAK